MHIPFKETANSQIVWLNMAGWLFDIMAIYSNLGIWGLMDYIKVKENFCHSPFLRDQYLTKKKVNLMTQHRLWKFKTSLVKSLPLSLYIMKRKKKLSIRWHTVSHIISFSVRHKQRIKLRFVPWCKYLSIPGRYLLVFQYSIWYL